MIEEMRKEGLLLLRHITEESKSTLDYNIFIVNKFLVKESGQWWHRLGAVDQPAHTTPATPRSPNRVLSLFEKMMHSLARMVRLKGAS